MKLSAKSLQTAIRRLPDPKTYAPDVINVLVDKEKYTFEKVNKEWVFKF
jgi:hypothetical protein